MATHSAETDPFDDILGLEDKFYSEGYALGATDGAQAGRIEGRVFGLEKGFEKYVEMGRLHGRALVWNSRLPSLQRPASVVDQNAAPCPSAILPSLPANPRLEKHLRVLYALTEPVSLSTENTEDAVSDFEDRLKRALGKIKIIDRLVGEEGGEMKDGKSAGGGAEANIEDVDILKARH
jgi:hypothetical protein